MGKYLVRMRRYDSTLRNWVHDCFEIKAISRQDAYDKAYSDLNLEGEIIGVSSRLG